MLYVLNLFHETGKMLSVLQDTHYCGVSMAEKASKITSLMIDYLLDVYLGKYQRKHLRH